MESDPVPMPLDAPGNQSDACPEPLSWREVLRRYRTESRTWEVERGPYTLRGRTWGDGPPLYFLSGIGGSHELLALLIWLLRQQFRCVAWDYPGTQFSTENLPGATAADLSADLFALADAHGDERFHLYATSFGAFVALEAMLAEQRRIEGAVLQGGFAHRKLAWFERVVSQACRHAPGCMRHLPGRDVIQRQNHRRWFPPFDGSRWEFLVEDTGRIPLSSVANRAAMVHNRDLRPRLGEIRRRVLLLRSEGEPENFHVELESGLPNAQSQLLHTSGHLPHLTHPHRTAKIVREFLLPEAASDANTTLESVGNGST